MEDPGETEPGHGGGGVRWGSFLGREAPILLCPILLCPILLCPLSSYPPILLSLIYFFLRSNIGFDFGNS